MADTTVVRKVERLTEQRFHELLMCGWARAVVKRGQGAFADLIEMSGRGLAKVLGGSTPRGHTIFNALLADQHALDDVLSHYNVRLVPDDEALEHDHAALPLSALLHRVIEAERPDSPGGTGKTIHELMAMEDDLRKVNALTAAYLDRINRVRNGAGKVRAVS